MSSKLTVGKVGGGTIDLTGFSPSLRKGAAFFDHNEPLIQMGRRFANGEASQGTFKLMDPDAELPRTDFEYNLPAHKIVTWTEDASGTEIWLARGRVSVYDGGREGSAYVDNEVGYDATVDDGNIDLRGQAFTVAWERPAESDYQRLVALQAYTLNGSSSTATKHRDSTDITVDDSHLAPNTETVTMPAKTYPVGTQPEDVVRDCADTAGKTFGVVIHHTGGSHDCLLYVKEDDHATYSTAVRISDHVSEWDPDDPTAPVFEPHWEQGKASIYDGQQLLSGLVSTYGAEQAVYVEHSSNVTDYDYWVDSYSDATSVTAAQAAERAAGILSWRRLTHVTHRVSIVMAATQLHLVTAGMSMEVKAAAMMGGQYLDTWQTRRIIEHSFEPRSDGKYWVHLQLDRAPKRRGYSGGTIPRPPIPATCDGEPTVVRSWEFTSATAITGMTVEGHANTALIVYIVHHAAATDPSFTYDPDDVSGANPTYAFTKYGEVVNTGGTTTDLQISLYYLLNPVASVGTTGRIVLEGGGGDHYTWAGVLVQDIDPDDLIRLTDSNLAASNMSNPGVISNSIASQANDLVLSIVGYTTQQQKPTLNAPVAGGDQTLLIAYADDASPGQDKFESGLSSQAGANQTNSWSVTGALGGAMSQWDIALRGCEGSITIGGPGEGTTGDSGSYVPGGTVIEHGDLSGKGGTMHDAEQIEYDNAASGMTADDVQAAIDELEAAISGSGAPADADYLVGTAHGSLSNEIVVGTTPGGELGGTWASPTVDSVHSGSAHVTALDGLSDVDLTTDPPADEEVLTFESSTSLWVPKPAAGGGSGLTVEEVDGAPSVAATTLVFPNGTLTDNGSGEVEYTPAGGGGGGLTQAYVGYNTIGASNELVTANRTYFKQIVLADDCLLTNIEVHVKFNSDNPRGMKAGVYTDVSGSPKYVIGAVYTAASSLLLLTTDSDYRWMGFAVGIWLPAGTYWIAWGQDNSSVARIKYDTSGSDKYHDPANPWLADGSRYTLNSTTNRYSMRANTIR